VANGEIHSPRDVRKEHKSAVQTFRSGAYGALGFIDEDRVVMHRRPLNRRVFQIDAPVTKVPLVKAYSGMDDTFLRVVQDRGAAGLVIECFPGRGGLPPTLLAPVRDLVEAGIPVVLAGAAEGRVSQTYGGPAGTRTFVAAGAISAGDLYPVKARILLMVLLSSVAGDVRKLCELFRSVAP
jgi:L-asparaginase